MVELQRKRPNGLGFDPYKASNGTPVAPLGEPVWVKATLRNTTRNFIIVVDGPISENFQVQVRTEDRRLVSLTSLGKSLASAKAQEERTGGSKRIRITLEPGQAVTRYYQVDRVYDMTLGGTFRIKVSRVYNGPSGRGVAASVPLPVRLESLPEASVVPRIDPPAGQGAF